MGTTPILGLPYPEPADPAAAGADNMKALALALEPGAWQNMVLISGCVAISGYNVPQYRLSQKRVELRGGVQFNSGAAIGSNNVVFATLPAGFRPSASCVFTAVSNKNTGATNNMYATGRLLVNNSGGCSITTMAYNIVAGDAFWIDGAFFALAGF